jgi:sugar transferase EpsL
MYRRYGKRAFDVVFATLLAFALLPALAVVAAAVYLVLGPPVLFTQWRPGLTGTPFRLVKFRSMTQRTDPFGNPLPDEARLTSFGRFLRGASLDELPELWNVIKGDMSLIGPRPLLMQYLARYTPAQARRHEVRPGITGLAQVSGRNGLSWPERFERDVFYVDHLSFWLDLRILCATVAAVLTRHGIHEPGHATSREFSG